jgi:hypothetical protein
MMNRIQVRRRRFGYKVGNTFLGVWEMPSSWQRAHRGYKDAPLICFAIPRPDAVDRKQIRALILQRMGVTKECER